jgi:acyl dehydratase
MDQRVGALADRLVKAGERVAKTVRFSHEDIVAFARMTFDRNPLHFDKEAARRARFDEIIAAGQHTSALMMGLAATHFSRRDDGVPREMLCLNFNFAFKHPVFAGQDVTLEWNVTSALWNSKLGGVLAHIDGQAAASPSNPAVIGRGTILVKEAG